MKILHALYSDRKGGLERAFSNVTKAMLELGHQVELLTPRHAPYLNELQYPLPCHDFKSAGYYSLNSWLRYHLLLRRIKPDLIVTHNSRAAYTMGRASSGLKIPHLAFSHGYKTRRFRSANQLVVLTEDMKQHFLACGYLAEQIHIFPNVIEQIPDLAPYSVKPSFKPIRLGFIGRLNEEKGLQDLLHAIALLNDSCSLELHVAGSGPDQQAIERLAGQLGILQRIHFSGWVENIASWMESIDLIVVPSRSESFGIVVLEAAAYGCPVISTSVAGPASQITHGVDGWLVEPGSPANLAEVVQQVVAAPESWVSVREAAYQRAQSYLMESRLDQLATILAQVVRPPSDLDDSLT